MLNSANPSLQLDKNNNRIITSKSYPLNIISKNKYKVKIQISYYLGRSYAYYNLIHPKYSYYYFSLAQRFSMIPLTTLLDNRDIVIPPIRFKYLKYNNFLSLFKKKFNNLTYILENIFKAPIQLELVRLHYPYHDSSILSQIIGGLWQSQPLLDLRLCEYCEGEMT